MADIMQKESMIAILRKGLEDRVKHVVTEQLVKEELDRFEVKLRERIESMVNKVSFDSIDSVHDALALRDELHVFLHWEDEVIEKQSNIEKIGKYL